MIIFSAKMADDVNHMHQDYLLQALNEAQKRRGFCAPNPSVGAVIVKNGRVLATASHHRAGADHAEVAAIKQVTESLAGASLYVSLEPCCHFGRTPPCTKAIIEAGFHAVFYAHADPNPSVSGRGAAILNAAGITCTQMSIDEIEHFYQSYDHWTKSKTPSVTAKLALSADDKIAGPMGEPVAITGDCAKEYTHQCRQRSDAILTTAMTILRDDPQLNVRLQSQTIAKPIYILDRRCQLTLDKKIFQSAASVTIFHDDSLDATHFQDDKVKCIPIECRDDKLDLKQVIHAIGKDGVHDLWVEAGGRCFQSLFEQDLLNRAVIYRSTKTLGDAAQSAFSVDLDFERKAKRSQQAALGEDQLFCFDY